MKITTILPLAMLLVVIVPHGNLIVGGTFQTGVVNTTQRSSTLLQMQGDAR